MYEELKKEFGSEFDKKGLDFDDVFQSAYKRVEHYAPDIAKNALREILRAVLSTYSASKSTTKLGRFFRRVAKIFGA